MLTGLLNISIIFCFYFSFPTFSNVICFYKYKLAYLVEQVFWYTQTFFFFLLDFMNTYICIKTQSFSRLSKWQSNAPNCLLFSHGTHMIFLITPPMKIITALVGQETRSWFKNGQIENLLVNVSSMLFTEMQ